MKGDRILCLNPSCNMISIDTTRLTNKKTVSGKEYQLKTQDSRERKFRNICPFCYGTNTINIEKILEVRKQHHSWKDILENRLKSVYTRSEIKTVSQKSKALNSIKNK